MPKVVEQGSVHEHVAPDMVEIARGSEMLAGAVPDPEARSAISAYHAAQNE